jgi:hypothetical protein
MDGPRSETPPGHWNLFAQGVSRRDGHDLDRDVAMFFVLNNALLDAGIAAWDCKRHFDSVRPITALRQRYAGERVRAWGGPGRGTREIDGRDWLPYQRANFITPPFPEYVSGHSTFSAAAAEILKRVTGSDDFGGSVTVAPRSSSIEPGITPRVAVTLSWATEEYTSRVPTSKGSASGVRSPTVSGVAPRNCRGGPRRSGVCPAQRWFAHVSGIGEA